MRTNISYSIVSHQTLITLVTFKYLLEDLEFLLSNSSKIKLKSQAIMILSFTLHQWISILFSTVAWEYTEKYVFQLHSWNNFFSAVFFFFFFFFSRLHFSIVKKKMKGRMLLLVYENKQANKNSVTFCWISSLNFTVPGHPFNDTFLLVVQPETWSSFPIHTMYIFKFCLPE